MSTIEPTTETFYNLFHLANEAVEEARRVKHLAFIKADHNPTHEHIREFLEADAALITAEKNLEIVRGTKKNFSKARTQ